MSVARGDRIVSLDILRGFALLGMLIVHFHDHSTEPGGLDDFVRTAVWRLVESKSHGTFALLFGAGFALQMRSAAAAGRPFVSAYLRRLAALAGFGFLAHACFGFNVLLGYAAWGVPLLAIRNWPTRRLIVAAVLSAVSVQAFNIAAFQYTTARYGGEAAAQWVSSRQAAAVSVRSDLEAAEAQDRYAVLLRSRLRHMGWFYSQPFSFMPGVTLALFIAGLLLVRHGVFERPLAHGRLLAFLATFGVVSWLAANWWLSENLPNLFGLLRDQWLMFTYVSAALALLAWRPKWTEGLYGVACAGRMALTNYLLQIAMLDVLFSGYALGLGPIRPIYGPLAAGAFFGVLMLLSVLWLRRFRLGPAEWLWRCATHAGWEPIRRVETAVEAF